LLRFRLKKKTKTRETYQLKTWDRSSRPTT